MVVGEPSLMGGEFGDEDERLITRLENTQYDAANSLDHDNHTGGGFHGADSPMAGTNSWGAGPGGAGPGDRGQGGAPPGGSTPQGGDSTQDKKSPAVSQWWQRTSAPKGGANGESSASGGGGGGAPSTGARAPMTNDPQVLGVDGISRAYLHWLQLQQQLQQELARFYFRYRGGSELDKVGQGPQDLSKKGK